MKLLFEKISILFYFILSLNLSLNFNAHGALPFSLQALAEQRLLMDFAGQSNSLPDVLSRIDALALSSSMTARLKRRLSPKPILSLPMSWPTYTEYSGRRAKTVLSVAGTLFIGHERGLSISHNAGVSFRNTTTAHGLGSNDVNGVAVSG